MRVAVGPKTLPHTEMESWQPKSRNELRILCRNFPHFRLSVYHFVLLGHVLYGHMSSAGKAGVPLQQHTDVCAG